MFEAARVFVVVPAFREEAHIARVIEGMPPEVDHVIVVDDASDDRTFEVACALRNPRVIALRHERNRGVGGAITTGYRHALSMSGSPRDAFVVMAGDGQMDPRDLLPLVAPVVRGEAGYAKGNRLAWPGYVTQIPPTRYVGGLVFTALTRVAIGIPIHDSQCGYTALSREVCSRVDLDALWPRFGYPNDLLSMLTLAKIRIVEVPVRPVYTHSNKLGARHLPIIAAIVGRAWWRRVRRG